MPHSPIDRETGFALLAALLRELCEDPLPGLTPATPLADIPGLDSVRLLEAVAMLEERLGVELALEGLDRLETPADIIALFQG
jgi:acyl carrier protein